MIRVWIGCLLLVGAGAAAEPPAPTDTVRIVDSGTEPRRVLRLKPQNTDEAEVRIEIELTMSQQMGKKRQATQMPKVRFDGTLKRNQISQPGHIGYTLTLSSIRVFKTDGIEKGTDNALRAKWKALKGMRFRVVLSERGQLTEAKLTLPTTPHPSLKAPLQSLQQTLRSMHVPFPAGAVGQGARWEVSDDVNRDGVAMKRTTTWTLDSLDGRLMVTGRAQESTDPTKVDLGKLPDDMTAKVKDVGGTGTLHVTLSEQFILPSSWKQVRNNHLTLDGTVGGNPFEMSTRVESKVSIERNPDP